MANNDCQCTAYDSLACSRKDADDLAELLEENPEVDEYHGFCLEIDDTDSENISVYLYAEDFGATESLSKQFLDKLGQIIAANNLPYLEFGYAFTCSRLRPGEFGGGTFRVYTDGKLEYPVTTFPRDIK